MDLIQVAIDKHGAKQVYLAAAARIEGDPQPLQSVDLIADQLSAAWAIMRQAYEQMSATEKAKEHWDASQALKDIPHD